MEQVGIGDAPPHGEDRIIPTLTETILRSSSSTVSIYEWDSVLLYQLSKMKPFNFHKTVRNVT